MNAITQTLLAGAALGALATAPAMGEDAPHFNLAAVHAGNVVNKTRIHDPSRQNLTYTFSVFTYVSFSSDFDKKVPLRATFYRWDSTSICTPEKRKFWHFPKKTEYAKLGIGAETYSFGCPSGPTTIYGITYKITNPDAEGHTDYFVATHHGKFQNSHGKYKATLNLDVNVTIGE